MSCVAGLILSRPAVRVAKIAEQILQVSYYEVHVLRLIKEPEWISQKSTRFGILRNEADTAFWHAKGCPEFQKASNEHRTLF